MFDKLKRVGEIAGLIASFFVILGLIRIFTYYQHYHINIVPYLDFSEILLSIFSDILVIYKLLLFILIYLSLVPIGLFVWQIVIMIMKSIERRKEKKQNRVSKKYDFAKALITAISEIKDPLPPFMRWFLGICGGIFFTGALIASIIGVFDSEDFYMSSSYIFVGFYIFLWAISNDIYKSVVFAILIGLLAMAINLGNYGSSVAKENAHRETWTFITGNDTIITNESLYLIGKTNNYYFVFDEKKSSTEILSTSEVKKAVIRYKK